MAMRRAAVVPKRSKTTPMGKVMKLFMKEPMVKTRENCSSCPLQSGDGHKWGMGTRRQGHGDTGNTRGAGTQAPGDTGQQRCRGHWACGDTTDMTTLETWTAGQ